MINKLLIFLILIIASSCDEQVAIPKKSKTTTFYLIRHAEKNRSNPNEKNPNLTPKGVNRSNYWARYFDSIPLSSIYTTSYKRTKQTIIPISYAKKITPEIYSPNKINIQDFIKTNYGKNVLISGHSNTTPSMVNKLIKQQKFSDMLDNDNKSLFVVRITDSNIIFEVRNVSIQN